MNELTVSVKLDPITQKWIVVIGDETHETSSWDEAEQLARRAIEELKQRARMEARGKP